MVLKSKSLTPCVEQTNGWNTHPKDQHVRHHCCLFGGAKRLDAIPVSQLSKGIFSVWRFSPFGLNTSISQILPHGVSLNGFLSLYSWSHDLGSMQPWIGIVSDSWETWTVSFVEWWKASQFSSEESEDDERGVPMTECGCFGVIWLDMFNDFFFRVRWQPVAIRCKWDHPNVTVLKKHPIS